MSRLLLPLLLLASLASCTPRLLPTPTPDVPATEAVLAVIVRATMTALAPTVTPTATETATPTATVTPSLTTTPSSTAIPTRDVVKALYLYMEKTTPIMQAAHAEAQRMYKEQTIALTGKPLDAICLLRLPRFDVYVVQMHAIEVPPEAVKYHHAELTWLATVETYVQAVNGFCKERNTANADVMLDTFKALSPAAETVQRELLALSRFAGE